MFYIMSYKVFYTDSTNKGDGFESSRIIEVVVVASKKSRLVQTGIFLFS